MEDIKSIRFVLNGKVLKMTCKYFSNIYNIPMYVSDNVMDIALFEKSNKELFIIVNNTYYRDNKLYADMQIYHTLLKKLGYKEYLCDVYTAYSFGFSNMISLLSTSSDNDRRIQLLEKVFRQKDQMNIKMPDISSLIKYRS